MHKRFVLSSSNAKPVLESNSEKYQFEQNFILNYPTDYKSRPPKKGSSHFANEMRLTELSNSVKIRCHTKFWDNFLIFKGLRIIRVNLFGNYRLRLRRDLDPVRELSILSPFHSFVFAVFDNL